MQAIFSTLVLLLVTVAPGLVYAQADVTTARRFCMGTLGQSKGDTYNCLRKPQDFDIVGRDPAVLTYLCCLGSFRDVAINYIPYLEKDLITMVASADSAGNLVSVGSFIAKCTRGSGRKGKASKKDYLFWLAKNKTLRACRAPYRK